jgi:glycosyltransferase involved in cell wall biosynthesis
MPKIELSLCICVWNTSHLLKRSIHSYVNQDLDPARWELIVIDDNSHDDVGAAIEFAQGRINVRKVRLEHSYGMRGNTVAFNKAFDMAHGHILAETTPETMLPRNLLTRLLEPHDTNSRCFVAMKTYNLTREDQALIDTVDWKSDPMAVRDLPGFMSDWTQNNVKTVHFGTHQTCSIRKSVFMEITNGRGFPLYCGYGDEDPFYAGRRESRKVQDITLPNDCMGVHQWHAPFQYWMAKGHGPMLNKFAHSMSNYMNDQSGEVPKGGGSQIWDGCSKEKLSPAEIEEWGRLDEAVLATGVDPNLLLPV